MVKYIISTQKNVTLHIIFWNLKLKIIVFFLGRGKSSYKSKFQQWKKPQASTYIPFELHFFVGSSSVQLDQILK